MFHAAKKGTGLICAFLVLDFPKRVVPSVSTHEVEKMMRLLRTGFPERVVPPQRDAYERDSATN